MSQPTIIETIEISKQYGMGDATVSALKSISLTIKPGEFVGIMGPSGSGKSTLMHILGCLSRPTSGKYILDGVDVSELNKAELAIIRNQKIGFVFQAYNLLSRTSALRNVMLTLMYNREKHYTLAESEELAMNMLSLVGLSDRMHHQPHELSGGQQQRVAIARALINNPALIIADEPTGNLDTQSGAEVLDLLEKLHEGGSTIVMVTHDSRIASHTQHIIHLEDGNIKRIEHNGHKPRVAEMATA
jgi:putative ABC transport system ATP-binding protein